MAAYVKRLYTDVLREKASFAAPLPGCVRAIYVANGMATVRAGDAATTAIYLHVTHKDVARIKSPLERLPQLEAAGL